MRKKIALGVLIISVLFTFTACTSKEAPPGGDQARVQAVTAVRAEKVTLSSKITASGKISPAVEVRVVPKSSGKVARVLCEVGQAVAAGSLLLELDNSDIQVRLESARASLYLSEANLEKARAQLDKTKIQVDDAKRTLDRKKALFDAGAISLSDYEAAKSAYESAKKDFEMNAASLASSRAGVDQSRASVRQSEIDLENSRVLSPVAGIVASRNVSAGEFVSNSTAAVVVVNIDTVEVSSSLLESEINHLKQGLEVQVAVSAVSAAPFKGKVNKISPSADQKAKTYPFWVAIDNPDKLLKPGMFAEIQMETQKREGVLAVPSEAVVDRNGSKAVYLVEGDKAVERKVKVGISDGGKTEIVEGLNEGEMVITTGLQTARDGMAVRVQGAQPQPKGS